MKLGELKQIEEGFFSNLKDKWRQGSYQNQVEKIFIQDFVQDAFVSLNNGVKGGLVDANIKSTPNAGSNTPPPSPGSPPGAAPGSPPGAAPGSPPGAAPGSPSPPDSAKAAAQRGRQTKAEEDRKYDEYVNKELKDMGLKIGDIVTVNLDGKQVKGVVSGIGGYEGQFKFLPNTTDPRAPEFPARVYVDDIVNSAPGTPTTESATYQKLNHLFENIVNTLEQAATGKMSISQYMMNWFGQYMQGVQWQGSKDTVQQMLDQLQDEYPNNATQNINNLARTAFALSKASSKPPAGAPDQFKKEKTDAPKKAEEIAADLGEIAATNPELYRELYANLPKPGAPGAAGTVAESRKRK